MQTSAERGSGEASTRRPSDRELIARFLAARDESAFAEIVTRYSRLVMSVALHTLRDPHAAEDAFQAAFLVLAKSARRIRNRDSLASWLHGTTYRVSHRLLRSRLRRKEQDLPSVELPSPIWAEPERPDEQAALDEELSRLSEGLRGPLVLHYLEGRTVPEIAAELMMSQAAVEGRLKRGKKTLRKRLLRRGVLLSSAVFGAGLTVPVEAGVAGALVTATVAACLKTAASASLTPIAATTIQQIALQEMAAMTRIAILKTALVCGGVAGAVGLAGAGANGTLGTAWARNSGGTAVAEGAGPSFDVADFALAPTSVIQTALAQVPGGTPNVVIESDEGVLTASGLQIGPANVSNPVISAVEGASGAPQAAGSPPNAIEVNVSDSLKMAAQQAAAKDQQIRALEEMVRALQAQVQQIREDQAREKRRVGSGSQFGSGAVSGTPGVGSIEGIGLQPGIFDPSAAGPAGGAAPQTGTIGVSGGFTGVPVGPTPGGPGVGAIQPGYGEGSGAGFGSAGGGSVGAVGAAPAMMPGMGATGGMGMGTMPGMTGSGMEAMMGMAGMGGFSQANPLPRRPKSIEDLLKATDKQKAKEVRDYLNQLEGRAASSSRRSRPAWMGAAAVGEVREFRAQKPAEERIRKSLETIVDFQFTGQSLQEVTSFLATQENIVIRIDYTALQNANVSVDQEINLVVSGISMRSALNLMLKEVGGTALDYFVADDVMVVTTKEKADETLQTVIYDVSGLGSIDPVQLETILERTVEPQTWEMAGGKGTIVPTDNALVVTTSRRLHDKAAEIMQMLQQQAKAAGQ